MNIKKKSHHSVYYYISYWCLFVAICSQLSKFLILDTCHPASLYLRERGCEDPWLFFEAKRGPQAKRFEKNYYR